MSVLVRLCQATVRTGIREILHPASLEIGSGELWAFLGGNGSGKTVLSELIAGVRAPSSGAADFAPGLDPLRMVHVLSFEEQLRLLGRERRADESWLMHGATDPGTTVGALVRGAAAGAGDVDGLMEEFRIAHLRDRGLRFLSTGEIRKAILCRALAGAPRILVLDDPYDGLDAAARQELHETIDRVSARGTTVVLIISRESEMSDTVSHVAYLADGAVRFAGAREAYHEWRTSHAAARPRVAAESGPVMDNTSRPIPAWHDRPPVPAGPLVRMRGVSVSYGDAPVLHGVTWTAGPGESWHIMGPNGAGKTTLLSLVTGSNAKAYGQDITLFGRRRGTGESVWDIKRRIGLVSGDFHNSYPMRTGALEAVLSGFTDSAGLYETATGHQVEVAMEWLRILGLDAKPSARLRELSYGQQRIVLVARAMVKSPPLLIADEPCQGLDDEHSAIVLSLLDRIAAETGTCLLYVSHNPRHVLAGTTHRLTLEPGPLGSTGRVS